MYYIYEHTKADTKEVFYVGKGKGQRAFKCRGRNSYWHRTVDRHGFDVKIVVDGLDEELAFLCESEYIDKLKSLGISLTNMTNGGEGSSGYKHTDEHKERLKGNSRGSSTWGTTFKGKTHSEEQKAKWRETRKGSLGTRNGVILSEKTKAKMSASKTGKPLLKNRVLSDDQVREIRVLLKNNTIASIARKFLVGDSTIRRIRDGERYEDVI